MWWSTIPLPIATPRATNMASPLGRSCRMAVPGHRACGEASASWRWGGTVGGHARPRRLIYDVTGVLPAGESRRRDLKPMKLRIVNIAGARPNFMKIAPLMVAYRIPATSSSRCWCTRGSTTTTTCRRFSSTNSASPRRTCTSASARDRMRSRRPASWSAFEPVPGADRPDLVVVVGDVNSTLACALVAVEARMPVAHVEAGPAQLRPHDAGGDQPHGHGRVSDCSVHDRAGRRRNLRREGVARSERSFLVGNVMIDTLPEIARGG